MSDDDTLAWKQDFDEDGRPAPFLHGLLHYFAQKVVQQTSALCATANSFQGSVRIPRYEFRTYHWVTDFDMRQASSGQRPMHLEEEIYLLPSAGQSFHYMDHVHNTSMRSLETDL